MTIDQYIKHIQENPDAVTPQHPRQSAKQQAQKREVGKREVKQAFKNHQELMNYMTLHPQNESIEKPV